jgi:hypothetical protein
LRPVPLSAAQPTRSTARNSQASAERARATQTDLMFSAAARLNPNPKPSTCFRAAVAFLLPPSAATSAVQDQEGH